MIVRAVVLIDLCLDGTWKIVQMHSAKPKDILPDKGEVDGAPLPPKPRSGPLKEMKWSPVQDHLDRARRVREHRTNYWSVTHGHCSICGACGKKRTTHRCNNDGHYHAGPPYAGDKCKEE